MAEMEKLTEVEILIMRVLWDHEGTPITIHQIANEVTDKVLSPASVTQAVNRMVKKNVVKQTSHVQVVNVYARTFEACIEKEDYLVYEIDRMRTLFGGEQKLSTDAMVAALVQSDKKEKLKPEEIAELKKSFEAILAK